MRHKAFFKVRLDKITLLCFILVLRRKASWQFLSRNGFSFTFDFELSNVSHIIRHRLLSSIFGQFFSIHSAVCSLTSVEKISAETHLYFFFAFFVHACSVFFISFGLARGQAIVLRVLSTTRRLVLQKLGKVNHICFLYVIITSKFSLIDNRNILVSREKCEQLSTNQNVDSSTSLSFGKLPVVLSVW